MLRTNRLWLLVIALLVLVITPMTASAQIPVSSEDTLVIRIPTEPTSLDPSQVVGGNFSIFMHMFGTLYELGQADGSIEPYLAYDYSISEDGTEWTFMLNEGLTCHDGSPLTADDVVYSFERVADPANGFTGNTAGFVLASIGYVGVRADGDLMPTIIMEEPQNVNLRLGLLSEVFIHCRESYEGLSLEEAARNPIGSGPYSFVRWVTGEYVEMTRVEGFTLRPNIFPTIVWRIIPEPSTAVAELITGNVDIIKELPATTVGPINDSGVAEVRAYSGTTRVYIGFNMAADADFRATPGGEAIMQTDVRVALQYAVNVPAICSQLLAAECTRATGPVNPPNDNPDLTPYPYDPAVAEELLDAAGWPRGEDGVRFSLTLKARRADGAAGSDVSLAVAQFLSDVGVQTEVEFLENADFIQQLIAHDLGPIFMGTTGGSTWSAQYDLADFPSPTGETNYTEWANEEFFALRATLPGLTNDPEAERATELAMLEAFYNDPPWLLLYPGPRLEAVSNRINYISRADIFITAYNASLK